MTNKYTHLNIWERQSIYRWYHIEKKSLREIGRRLKRSHSTISREIKRNINTYFQPTYHPHPAQQKYKMRKQNKPRPMLLKTETTRDYVIQKLKVGWSPEIISGRLKTHPDAEYICHESIYQFIYREAPELIKYLPRKHKRRRKKYPRRKTKSKIPYKTSILDRPQNINKREVFGHWESDSIESCNHKGGLNVLLERQTRLTKIRKIANKKSETTANAIAISLKSFPADFVNSITYDNGTENAKHHEINKIFKCDSYFCQPYHSWEKGAVEQLNGLIRRVWPKGTNFNEISWKEINEIETLLNNRPRKCLNYKTPIEAYNEIHGALAC